MFSNLNYNLTIYGLKDKRNKLKRFLDSQIFNPYIDPKVISANKEIEILDQILDFLEINKEDNMNINIYDDIKEKYPSLYEGLEELLLLKTDNLVNDLFQTKFMLSESINGYRELDYTKQSSFMMFDCFNSFNRLNDNINSLYDIGYISKFDKGKISFDNHHVKEYNIAVEKFFNVLSKSGLEFDFIPIVKVLEFKGIESVLRNIYHDNFDKIKSTDNNNDIKECYDIIYDLESALFDLEKFRLIDKESVSFVLKGNNE